MLLFRIYLSEFSTYLIYLFIFEIFKIRMIIYKDFACVLIRENGNIYIYIYRHKDLIYGLIFELSLSNTFPYFGSYYNRTNNNNNNKKMLTKGLPQVTPCMHRLEF